MTSSGDDIYYSAIIKFIVCASNFYEASNCAKRAEKGSVLVLKITKNPAISIDHISIDLANNRKLISISREFDYHPLRRERCDRFEYFYWKNIGNCRAQVLHDAKL